MNDNSTYRGAVLRYDDVDSYALAGKVGMRPTELRELSCAVGAGQSPSCMWSHLNWTAEGLVGHCAALSSALHSPHALAGKAGVGRQRAVGA